jgi:phasin family protein
MTDKPNKPASVAAKPVPAAAKSPETAARKRGRPPGAKNVARPVAAKTRAAVVAKATPPRPGKIAPNKIVTKPVAPRAAATPSEGAETMTDTMAKIQDTAKKFTGDAGARTQAMFGDISSKAKGAYEKSVKLTEEFSEFQKGNVEAIVESSKLAAKAAETLGQNAADYARKSYETGTAAFKTFASAKSPTELFKLQSDYLKSYFDSAVAEGTKATEAWLKLAGDVAQPLSNRVAVAVEKVKATAAI